MVRSLKASSIVAAGSIAAACGLAHGQYTTNFEAPTYNASATGTLSTGQAGWYLPSAGGLDHNMFTYAGNSLGVAANPSGGAQFDAGLGGSNVARCQHPVDFSAGGTWTAEFDVNGLYVGTLPAVDNLGSFSMQPSGSVRYFQQLMNWGSTTSIVVPPNTTLTNYTATADHFHMAWGYTATSAAIVERFELPSTAWMDLPVNHWYHVKVTWNFDAPDTKVLSVSIRDLTAGTPEHTDDVSASNWYLAGYPASVLPLPTDIRLFAGGAGSATAWDNVNVYRAQTCYANCDGSTIAPILNVNDFICFQTKYAQGDSNANCDGSTIPPVLNVNDFICFQTRYAQGCP